MLNQPRCELTAYNPITKSSSSHYFVWPTRGQEATVGSIYAVCSSVLTTQHFEEQYGIADMADWWPALLHYNNAEVRRA